MKVARKTNIELIRFVASMGVMMGHTSLMQSDYGRYIRPWPRGYIYVELFLMLTGCFCAAHVDQRKIDSQNAMKYAANYTKNKLIKLLPYAFVGVVLCYVWRFVYVTPSYNEGVKILLEAPFEVLLLNITGISDVQINAPMWYLSVMLLVLPLFMYLMIRFPDAYKNYISWAVPFIVYGYLIMTFGALDVWGNSPIYLVSALRAFAGLCLGSCCYYIAGLLKERNSQHPILLGILEIIILCTAIYASYVKTQVERIDMAIVLLFFFLIVLSYSGMTCTARLNSRFIFFLGRLSSPIYCLHWSLLLFTQAIFTEKPFIFKLCIAILVTMILSIPLLFALERLQRKKRIQN